MPWSQEEAIVLANVAERAERYDDMIEYMKATLRPVGRFRNLKLPTENGFDSTQLFVLNSFAL